MNAARQQTWAANTYNEHARFVSDLAGAVLDWLAVRPGECVLDLGCGDGVITADLARAGALVVGVDMSDSLLSAARALGVDARKMDGEALSFVGEFDAVFSNAALHWMINAEAVIAGVYRALKPGGRFVAEFGGHGNVAAVVTAMRATAMRRGGDQSIAGPWFYPTPHAYQNILEQAGFAVKRIGLFPRPTLLKTGMAAWLMVMRAPFFEQFGPEKAIVLKEVEDLLRPALCDVQGNWTADYVRLRLEAVKA